MTTSPVTSLVAASNTDPGLPIGNVFIGTATDEMSTADHHFRGSAKQVDGKVRHQALLVLIAELTPER